MKSISAMLTILLVLFYASPTLKAADAAAGKALYTKKCSTCHDTSGEGKAAIAALLKIEFKDLRSKEVQSKSDAELKKIILEGMGKMKPVKDVDAKAADDVIAYLRTMAKK